MVGAGAIAVRPVTPTDPEAVAVLPDPFRVIAHRGASGCAPENTTAAFRAAVAMGVAEVETDVHFTRDGHLVLLHDHALDRTTDGTGPPGACTLAQLKDLDAGSWFNPQFAEERLLTLDELFAEFGPSLVYHVELKDRADGTGEAVARAVSRFGLNGQTFVTGFDCGPQLLAARRAAVGVRSCVLVPRSQDPRQAIDEAAAAGHQAVSLAASAVTGDLVDRGHALGLEVRCWGVRDRADMVRATEAGCNGMTINWPDWLQEWVASRR